MPMMSPRRWRALCSGTLREARESLMSDPWPKSLADGPWRVSWGLHSAMGALGGWPSSLLIGQARFDNGYSATLVYGCGRQGLSDWQAVERGPWPLSMGVAARCGDEASGGMLACFDPSKAYPALCDGLARFEEARPEQDVGARTAMTEPGHARSCARALRLIDALPSSWDAPEQERLWRVARAGQAGELSQALRDHPEWAWRKWSQGSSLMALCVRLGRWGSVEELAALCAAEELARSSTDCAVALADFCVDWAPLWTVQIAPKALLRAWSAGALIDGPMFVERLASSKDGRERAWSAWAHAEKLWLQNLAGEASAQALASDMPRRL
jgi:hypothetical protein